MTTLVWNSTGTRYFETGTDRGVLYLDDVPGVAWSGLTSVSESPSGGSITPFYVDGIKYDNYASREDFEATVTAYTYPDEFDACIGVTLISHGLFATQQKKASFGLSYRTKVGNDLDGADHAYKIHLVYNAMAETSDASYKTVGDSVDANEFSWHIVTKPPLYADFTPTAHFIVDSRDTTTDLISILEDILYGTTVDEPRLPSIDELIFIFKDYAAQNYDAGYLGDVYYADYDAGVVGRITPDVILDGGGIGSSTGPLGGGTGGGGGGSPDVVAVDNGDGTYTAGGSIVDQGDGTFAATGTSVSDQGDGTLIFL